MLEFHSPDAGVVATMMNREGLAMLCRRWWSDDEGIHDIRRTAIYFLRWVIGELEAAEAADSTRFTLADKIAADLFSGLNSYRSKGCQCVCHREAL